MQKNSFLVLFNFLILLTILPAAASPIDDFIHYLRGERNITLFKDSWIYFSIHQYLPDDIWRVTPGVDSSFPSREKCNEFGRHVMESDNNRSTGIEHKYLCGKNCKYDVTGITCELLCGPATCLENQGPTFYINSISGYW